MIQLAGIHFKNADLSSKRKLEKALITGLCAVLMVVASFCYWRYLTRLSHGRGPTIVSRTVPPVAVPTPVSPAPATATQILVASAVPPAAKPALTNAASQISEKPAAPSFADSVMAVLAPSAKAETIQPEMPPAQTKQAPVTVPASRLPLVTPAVAHMPAVHAPPTLTERDKMLQTAQSGFNNVMDLALRFPDAYGFGPDENLRQAKLGNPITVYRIAQQDGKDYQAGQPLKPLLKPADQWVFPIMLGNQIRYMVQVDCVNHQYVLGNGSRALAMVYEHILQQWPASEGFHPQLIMNADQPDYFFTVPELPEPNITDTSRMFEINPRLSPAAVILASWQ
jgi:hypothetical protein